MDKVCISRMVGLAVAMSVYTHTGDRYIPAAGSNRHIHLCEADISKLFGAGYRLNQFKNLSQPGQFAAKEKVDLVGPKGSIKGVRVLGPARKLTQVEVFYGDCFKLGIRPDIRMSGDINGTSGITLVGPAGQVKLDEGLIVAARHVHISKEQAKAMDLKNGDLISLRKDGIRSCVFEDVPVRCGDGHSLELHLDMEEANAAVVKNGELLEVTHVLRDGKSLTADSRPMADQKVDTGDVAYELLTELDVVFEAEKGKTAVTCTADGVITPLAKDKAKDLGMKIVR